MRYTCSINLNNERQSASNTPPPSDDHKGVSLVDAAVYIIPYSASISTDNFKLVYPGGAP